jgi:hypothetical protein
MRPATEAASQPGQKVFISYRREETAPYAGRLYDAMAARFGERNVFMDVGLAPGVDFVERITEVVSGCVVLIVVMGPSWATVRDEEDNVRLADPDDFVRLEVETALRRHDVTPIPVLVGGARMPRAEQLPGEQRPLLRRNALEMSDARWSYDVGRLNGRLNELLAGIAGTDGSPPRPQDDQTEREPAVGVAPARMLIEGMLVAGVTAYLARRLVQNVHIAESDELREIAGVVLRRGVTWALTGAALAVWLGLRTRRSDVVRVALIGLLLGALGGTLGAALWGAVVIPTEEANTSAFANQVNIGGLAVTGALLGALLGWLWRPPRVLAGLAGSAAGAALIQLFLNATALNASKTGVTEVVFGIWTAAIVGAGLAVLIALDSQADRATRSAAAGRTG